MFDRCLAVVSFTLADFCMGHIRTLNWSIHLWVKVDDDSRVQYITSYVGQAHLSKKVILVCTSTIWVSKIGNKATVNVFKSYGNFYIH